MYLYMHCSSVLAGQWLVSGDQKYTCAWFDANFRGYKFPPPALRGCSTVRARDTIALEDGWPPLLDVSPSNLPLAMEPYTLIGSYQLLANQRSGGNVHITQTFGIPYFQEPSGLVR